MPEYYDKYKKRGAIHWDWYENGTQAWYRIIVDKIIDYYKSLPPGTVLDIGCGDGLVSSKIIQFHKVIGIDIDPIGINLAKQKTKKMAKRPTFIIKNFNELFSLENKFNYILMLNTIEHLKNPFKVLRDLIRLNNDISDILIITDYPGVRPGRHHVHEFTKNDLHKECKVLDWKATNFYTGVYDFHGLILRP